ncbi:MAG: YlzJ-like family protein [Bacteroidota bacterium]
MFLYTVIPAEIIFASDEEGEVAEERLVEKDGVRFLARRDGTGGMVLSRLLSTDPRDFLDRRWEPGTPVEGW